MSRRARPATRWASFPELVWAHHMRLREMHEDGKLHGEAEAEYRRQLEAFEAAEGRILNAYWCTSEASAVALTERRRRRLTRRREIRFHAATDWVAGKSPEIANMLHRCETLAVRVSEVLTGASERIAMQSILASAGHLLGFVDKDEPFGRRETARIVGRKRRELDQIEEYYHRAGVKVGRIVYFGGMMVGLAVVAAIGLMAAGLLWWRTDLDPGDKTTQQLFASYAMGALGAIVSVMTRMASSRENSFAVDFEVGRGSLVSLGAFRPVLGAISALLVFFAMKSELLQVLPDKRDSFYVFAVVAFAAGFSERWAKVALGPAERILAGGGDDDDQPAKAPKSGNANQTT